MSDARNPTFLDADEDAPSLRIRCPIHGFIHFSPNERRVIDHRLFRRLRNVRQLALTEYLYPGANHTRFEHSLGVMEVATRAFDILASKQGAKMEAMFAQIPELSEHTMAKARQFLRLAALLHDSGHAAFSHAAESVVQKDADHEALSVEIIQQSGLMGDLLRQQYGEECPKLVAHLIKPPLPPQLRVLRDLISGQMDADRIDYLLRDAYHCGVEYGKFDYLRMIECLDLYENDAGGIDLALNNNGIHTLEAMVLARYQMNTQVYFHRVRRIYDQYLIKYHMALDEDFTADTVLTNNDVTMMARILGDAEDSAVPQHQWAKRIAERRHHREIFITEVTESELKIKTAKNVFLELQRRYTEGVDLLFDTAEGNIHKLQRPDDSSGNGWVQIYLMGRGNPRLITQDSQILRTIPRAFLCARIFADAPQERLREIQQTAKEVWQSNQ